MKSTKELVPLVVYHEHENYSARVYKYQVYIAEYDRSKHIPKNISTNYVCFNSQEEVEAYCQGLEAAGITYKGKRKQQ